MKRSPPGLLLALLLVLLVALPWPLGANRDWYWPYFAAAAFGLLAIVLAGAAAGWWRAGLVGRGTGAPSPNPLPGGERALKVWLVLLGAWVGWGVVQVVAPEAWIGRVVDPDAAVKAVVQQGFCAALALLVLVLADSVERLRAIAIALFVVGLAQAVYGSFMTLSGVEWGWFAPKVAGKGLATGTYVNRNHYAAFLALTASLGTGLLVAQLSRAPASEGWRRRARDWVQLVLGPKAALRVALVMIVIGLVLSQSRMGNLSFLLAFGVIGVYALLAMRPLPRSLVVLLVSIVVLDVFVIGSRFGLERVAERLRETTLDAVEGQPNDAERVIVAQATLGMWHEAPVTGIGPGGFRTAFPGHRPASVPTFYDHAHNDWVQILAERGVIGLLFWAGLVGVAFGSALMAVRQRRDPRLRGLAFGAAMALLAMAIHAVADFNWQIPANSAVYSVVMALALGCRKVESGRRRS